MKSMFIDAFVVVIIHPHKITSHTLSSNKFTNEHSYYSNIIEQNALKIIK